MKKADAPQENLFKRYKIAGGSPTLLRTGIMITYRQLMPPEFSIPEQNLT